MMEEGKKRQESVKWKKKRACSVLSNFKTKLSLKPLHTFSADENVLSHYSSGSGPSPSFSLREVYQS